MEDPAGNPTRSDNSYQLIVIGGGCNGTGIARDAAMRGIRTLLLEKEDFATGATGASSRMIHGGPRYLLYDRQTTELSCIDSGYIQKIAPHLLFRIPFLIPYLEKKRGNWAKKAFMHHVYPVLMEAYFRGYDRYQVHKNGKPYTRLSRAELFSIEPGITPDALGAVSIDEWGIDPWRLCVLNALSAQEHGADIKIGIRVTGFVQENGQVQGVHTSDQLTGQRQTFFGDVVMNATGAWSPGVASLAKAEVKLRPGKGTHLVLDRRISNWGICGNAVDGRQIILWPDQNTTLVGTTDEDFYGDPDSASPSQDEIHYLLQGIERLFPSIRGAQVIRSFAGVRPTLFAWNVNEEDLSRHHKVIDHTAEGAAGLLSIAGGKLASFRLMAEEATDTIAAKLQNANACTTHKKALPGGETQPDPVELANRFKIDIYGASRLVYRHGAIAEDILEAGDRDGENTTICACEAVMVSELRHCMTHEFVRKPSDLTRRTRLGLGPCSGHQCARMAARAFCAISQAHDFDVETAYQELKQPLWEQQAPVLQGSRLRQAALEQQWILPTQAHREHTRCKKSK